MAGDPWKTNQGGKNPSPLLAGVNAINNEAGGQGNFLDQTVSSVSSNLWGDQNSPGLIGGARQVGNIYNPNAGSFGSIDSSPAFGIGSGYLGQGQAGFGQSQQGYLQQQQLIQMLQQQAAGQGPSAAQDMLRQAQDRNEAMAAGQAASVRGGGAAAAGYNAANSAAMANQQAAGDASQLRAQEMLQGRALLGQQLGQQRQQDLQQQQIAGQMAQQYVAQGYSVEQANRQAAIDLEKMRTDASLQTEKLRNEAYSGGEGGGSFLGGLFSAMSDENLKTDIKPADTKLYDFLDSLGAHSYEYKDPKHGEGRRTSVMAQELERTPEGKEFVFQTKDGKAVDYGKGLGTMLAAQAALHRRLKKLEGK